MLIDALRIMVNNPFKKKFYEKKKIIMIINVLIAFSIFHKSDVKIFRK